MLYAVYKKLTCLHNVWQSSLRENSKRNREKEGETKREKSKESNKADKYSDKKVFNNLGTLNMNFH